MTLTLVVVLKNINHSYLVTSVVVIQQAVSSNSLKLFNCNKTINASVHFDIKLLMVRLQSNLWWIYDVHLRFS